MSGDYYGDDRRTRCEVLTKQGKRCRKLGNFNGSQGHVLCLWHWKSHFESGKKLRFWSKPNPSDKAE